MKRKKILLSGFLVTLGFVIGSAIGIGKEKTIESKAATQTTVYCAISSTTKGSYSLKLNTNQQTDPDSWKSYEMIDTGTDYAEGVDLYSYTFTDLWDGVACMQFQLYNGNTWVEQNEAISSWKSVSEYNGKTWIYGNPGSWDVERVDVTLKASFTSDVPNYVDIYVPGGFNSWADDNTTSKMTRTDARNFTYSLNNVAEGEYSYKLVACYSGSSTMDWNHQIDASNQTITITSSDADTTKSLGERTYDFASNMPQETVADGAVVQLTFASSVPSTVDIIFVGGLTNWGTSSARLEAGKMVANATRLIFTWAIPEGTYTGTYEYKIVAMSKYSGETTASYDYLVYGVTSSNEVLTIDTTTITYSLNALSTDLSELGALAFAQHVNSELATPCSNPNSDNKSAVSTVWSDLKEMFEGLTSGSKTSFSSSSNAEIVQAKTAYLHIVSRYGLATWDGAPSASQSTIRPIINSANYTLVAIIIGSISLISLGGFFLLKKKKEN